MPDANPRDDVEAALSDVFHNAGDMVTRWVLTAEVIEDDGARALWVLNPDSMEIWDTLGLLAYATELCRRDVSTLDAED